MSRMPSLFSPLALTRVLTTLPLAQGDVDYQVARRTDPDLLPGLLTRGKAVVILVRRGRVAVPRGQGLLAPRRAGRIRLATIPAAYLADALGLDRSGPAPEALYYLGSRQGADYLALDLGLLEGTCPPGAGEAGRLVDKGFDWVGLDGFAPHASPRQVGLATSAVCLSNWQTGQRFCPLCGSPVRAAQAGWAQTCVGRGVSHTLFPRVEPAVITSIVDADDRLLLQHNRAWKEGLVSVCAGFVEAGENLEHAARREAMEEVGVPVGELRYMGSQPWPFPASLMVAFKGRALDTAVRTDGEETLSARWVSRDDLVALIAQGDMELPGRATIARSMIQEWYGSDL